MRTSLFEEQNVTPRISKALILPVDMDFGPTAPHPTPLADAPIAHRDQVDGIIDGTVKVFLLAAAGTAENTGENGECFSSMEMVLAALSLKNQTFSTTLSATTVESGA
ncbi:hypothetical protein BDP27DRAFT_1425476 [Rhodocollybia butyracea]|uniref:Uncharacterized protein n=1 Tax=Rhodocollybia butyracea TaxID=206335 RepID=A0A9P5U2M4_9AGAR|nr:hypothetical protein BDP27DRAFT_1425476 [Rhodocollybia butyracea]